MSSQLPKGTAHRRKAPPASQASKKPSQRKPLTPRDLTDLRQQMKDKFGLKYEPRDFQVEAVASQLKLRDAVVNAGTGMGKTLIAAGPHAHPSAKGKVTLMVSPLLALHKVTNCPQTQRCNIIKLLK